MTKVQVKDANGKLGVLVVGVGGSVASTFIAGTLIARKGEGVPVGSITQLATIRLGKREENRFPFIKDALPIAKMTDMVFGGWDIFEENLFQAATHSAVLTEKDLDKVKDELTAIKPMKAVFNQEFVKRLHGTWVKSGGTKMDQVNKVREDIQNFKKENNLDLSLIHI